MPSRQLSERRDEQSLFNAVISKARKPESIGALAQGGCGMNMPTQIQAFTSIHGGLWFMTEPEVTQSESRMLGKKLLIQAAVVVATDQQQLSVQSLMQVFEICLKTLREPKRAMDQISKNDHPFGVPLLAELLEPQQCRSVVITGERDSAGLKHLCLSKMQISNEKFLARGSPDGFLSQQHQFFLTPLPSTSCGVRPGVCCWRAISPLAAVLNVDGSQQ